MLWKPSVNSHLEDREWVEIKMNISYTDYSNGWNLSQCVSGHCLILGIQIIGDETSGPVTRWYIN
jgi:hypothetical protein